jgi:phage shock protein A
VFHGITQRVSTGRANLNDLIDKAEDPEMIKQVTLDMQNQLLRSKHK